MTSPFPRDAYEFTTPRLVVRSAVPSDAEALCGLLNDPMNRPLEKVETVHSPESMRARIDRWKAMAAQGQNAFMVITLRETGKLIGLGGFNCFESEPAQEAEEAPEPQESTGPPFLTDIGVMLERSHWRKGYATEALCASVEFAFAELGCRAVRIETDNANEPWRALMETAGLTTLGQEGQTSYREKLTGWVWKLDQEGWETAKNGMRANHRWPL